MVGWRVYRGVNGEFSVLGDGSVADLVVASRAGDLDAEARLARRAAGRALRTAAMALGDLEAGRDVSQEVAVRAIQGLSRLRDPDRFDAWVSRIIVGEVRRALGRRRRRAEVPLIAELADDRADRGDPSVRLFATVELRAALAELSVRERTAIALRYVEDLDDRQIAAAMRCRPGTVRSLLTRARSRLRANPALAEHDLARTIAGQSPEPDLNRGVR